MPVLVSSPVERGVESRPENLTKAEVGSPIDRSEAQREQQSLSQKGPVDLLSRAQEVYKALEDGMFGCGTDEARLFAALEGLSPQQVERLRVIYQEHYGKDLDEHIAGDLSGAELDQARSLLKGDKAAAAADALAVAMQGAGTDEEQIRKVLTEYTGDRTLLEQKYKERYGQNLREALSEELSGDLLTEMNSLLNGDKIGAAAARIHQAIDGAGTDEAVVRETLAKLSKDELSQLNRKYQSQYGESLSAALKGDFSSLALVEVEALAVGESRTAAAARLRAAVENSDREAIQAEFIGKSESERKELVDAYNKIYSQNSGGLLVALKAEFSVQDYSKIESAISRGELTLEQRFHDCLDGAGTGGNINELLEELGKLPEDQARAINASYKRSYGESLGAALEGDLSGRVAADAALYLNGLPSDPIARELAIARRNIAMVGRERDGFSVGNLLLDGITDKDERVDQSTQKLAELLKTIEKNGTVSAEELRTLKALNSWVKSDLDDVRGVKDSVAETTATVTSTVAAGVAIVATAGAATPLVVAAAVAAGGTGYVAGRAMVQGSDYEIDGMAVDVLSGGVDGALNVVGAGVASRVVGGLARNGIGRVAVTTIESAVDAGLGGAAGGVVQTGLQRDNWNNGVLAGLENIGEAALVQGAVGALTGVGMSAATRGASHLVSSVAPGRSPDPIALEPNSFSRTSLPLAPTTSSSRAVVDLPEVGPGGSVVLGRAGDVVIDNPHVSRQHAQIIRESDGSYFIRDGNNGNSSMAGTYLVDAAGKKVSIPANSWTRVEPGQILSLGNITQVRVPPQEIRIVSGEPLEIGRSPLSAVRIPNDSRSVSGSHAVMFASSDGRIYVRDGGLNGERSTNGTFLVFSDGRSVAVGSDIVEVPDGCQISLGKGYLITPKNARPQEVIPKLDDLATRPVDLDRGYKPRSSPIEGEDGRTIRAGELRLGDGYVRGLSGAQDQYLGRPVIGAGTPIHGGIYIGQSRREAIVFDFKNATLEKSYQEFLQRMEKLSAGSPERFKESVLQELHNFVDKKLGGRGQGIMGRVEHLLESAAIKDDRKVNLGFFIDAGAGVCRHRALMVAGFLERMIKEGHLNGSVEVRRNGISGVGAHAWALYRNSAGDEIVIDPMQGFVGRVDDARAAWDYRSNQRPSQGDGQTLMVLHQRRLEDNSPELRAFLKVLDAKNPEIRVHTTEGGHVFVDWGNINGLADNPGLLSRARHQIGAALQDMSENSGLLRNVRHNSEMAEGVTFMRLNNGRGNTRVVLAVDPQGLPHVLGSYTHGDGVGNDYGMFENIINDALRNDAFRWAFSLPARVNV